MSSLQYLLRLTAASALVALAWLLLLGFGFQRVEPGWIGVRQGNFGAGIDAHDHAAGLHFAPRGLYTWHQLDGRVQLLRFGPQPAGEHERAALDFRTRDNSTAKAECVVAWRVRPGRGHAIVRAGLERNLPQRVAGLAEDVLRRELGLLQAEDWFLPARLEAEEKHLLPLLAAALESLQVEALGAWLLDAGFPAEYERKLQERQVTWQRELLTESSQRTEQARADAQEIAKDTEVAEAELRADGTRKTKTELAALEQQLAEISARAESYEKHTKAQAELDYQRAIAQATLELEQAKALANRLRMEVLGGAGGKVWLARQAAQNLNVKSVTLDSRAPGSPSLIDLDAFVGLLLGAAPNGAQDLRP
jgi:regulator of protease activity HflC (stomatin/prohibitin superfamily)